MVFLGARVAIASQQALILVFFAPLVRTRRNAGKSSGSLRRYSTCVYLCLLLGQCVRQDFSTLWAYAPSVLIGDWR